MHKLKKHITLSLSLSLLFILISNMVLASNIDTQQAFRQLNNKKGLSYNTVRDIVQDASGVMWIATRQGLNKYNSYGVRSYFTSDSPNSLPDNDIKTLAVSNSGLLFVGSGKGLAIYNERLDNFDRIHYEGQALKNINKIVKSDDDNMLIATTAGIYRYNIKIQKLIKFISLENRVVTNLLVVNEDLLVCTSGSTLYMLNADGTLVDYFNTQDIAFIRNINCLQKHSHNPHLLWVGTENEGLFLYHLKEKKLKTLGKEYFNTKASKLVRTLQYDQNNQLWIGGENGIFIINNEGQLVDHKKKKYDKNKFHLNDNAIYSLYLSQENIMWVGTYFGGVNYTALGRKNIFFHISAGEKKDELSGRAVNQIYKSKDNTIWIATEDGGVTSLDPVTKKVINRFIHQGKNSISSNNIHAITEDKYGRIWFGNFLTGIDVYDPQKNQFTNICNDWPSHRIKSVTALYTDSQGNVWVGLRNGKLWCFDNNKKKLEYYSALDKYKLNKSIFHITEDKRGQLCISVLGSGLIIHNPKTKTTKHYHSNSATHKIPVNNVVSSMQDSRGFLYLGTIDQGFLILDPNNNSFTHITSKNGLANNTIYGLLEDNQGQIWMSSNEGINSYNPDTKKIKNYTIADGLYQKQFNINSFYKGQENTLYFGNIDGLVYFSPENISLNETPPVVLLTDFKLNNKSVVISKEGPLKQHINHTGHIDLKSHQRSFALSFAAINYFSPRNNQFLYKLEGFDKQWYPISKHSEITYTNVPPGKYTFYVKATNNDGIESLTTKQLNISIQPPWYRSILAFVLYFIALIAVFMAVHRYNMTRMKHKNELHIERMEKEKIKELNTQRLNFYTYISHEFKTPLAIIVSTLDDLFKNKDVKHSDKERIQRLNRSSKRLSFLLSQLMDFRKIETKHAEVVLKLGDVISFMKDVCYAFEALFQQQDVYFEFDSNVLTYETWFDDDKIEKILVNLISNAIKNTKAEDTIACSVCIIKDSVLEIKISDTGKGMTKEAVNELFTPYYMNYDEEEFKRNSSGIGLTFVKSIVDYLHGHIEVYSTLGKGSEFVVSLPLSYTKEDNVVRDQNQSIKKAGVNLSYVKSDLKNSYNDLLTPKVDDKPYQMLIVEDTADLAQVLVEHYNDEFTVHHASNGKEALEMIEGEEPDIIISDVMMPKMDGIEFCKQLKSKEATSHISVFLLTARDTHDDKITGLKAGAEAYITKPFDFEEVDLLVRNSLNKRNKLNDKIKTQSGELDIEEFNIQDKDKEFVKRLHRIVLEHLGDAELNTDKLAQLLGMSKTLVYLKLKKLLNTSASDYILSMRLAKAEKLLISTQLNISEVAYEVGYADPNYFTKVFKKAYKMTPRNYKKHNSEV